MSAARDRSKRAATTPNHGNHAGFRSTDAVMAAITAIAEHCERNGQKRCADSCRKWLDYVCRH